MSLSEHRGGNTLDRVVATARRNPEGVLLLAAGVALLMRGHASRDGEPQSERSRPRRQNGDDWDDARDEAQGLMHNAAAYASDMASRVGRSAESVAEHTSQMAHGALDRTSRIASGTGSAARGAVDRMLDEQPLTVALFGLAAGALMASTMPPTGVEREALGPVGRRLNKTVDEAGSRLKKSAKKAGKRLGEVADERGLNAEGLRDAAREVADTFEEELMADEPDASGRKKGSSRATFDPARPSAAALDPMDPARRMADRERERTAASPPSSESQGDGASSNADRPGQVR